MSRIGAKFAELSGNGSGAYIPYVCAGDPDKEFTVELIEGLCSSGADIVELGIPFSDPLADGPVIQGAMKRSLDGGFRIRDTFRIVSELRKRGIQQPIVLMTYANPVFRMGVREFCTEASKAGADGILPVDLPPEESNALEAHSREQGLDLIRLIAPSTSDSRMDEVLSRSSGFVYAVSVSGVTGARERLPDTAVALIRRVASRNTVPVALGFGISRPEHVHEAIAAGAAGVVEGSALISRYASRLDDPAAGIRLVVEHAREMKRATSRSGSG